MKQIEFVPIEERTMNDKLVNLYGKHIVGLYTKIEKLYNDDWYKGKYKLPAAPLLIELESDDNDKFPYETADIRIMFFGRETNNWDDRHDTRKDKELYTDYGTYNFYLQNNDDILAEIRGRHTDENGNDLSGQDERYGLTDIYINYLYSRDENTGKRITVGKSPFTKWCYSFVDKLQARYPDKKVEFVWNNLFKIGNTNIMSGHSRSKSNSIIRDIEKEYFDVIESELEILKPDIIIFTPLDEDKTILEKFNIGQDAYATVDSRLPELKRIDIPNIKYAARTIHPSTQGTSNEIYRAYDIALIDDMMKHL